jgi:hypothetical protein
MSRWVRGLFADWQLKLLGLTVAVALWAYVHSLQSIELTLSVPLEFRNVPRATRFVRRPPATVEVRLLARWDMIPRLAPRTVKAVVDLTRLVTGRYVTIPLTSDQIQRPAGVDVVSISPAQLALEFESGSRREEER